jgi:hypothetical protein
VTALNVKGILAIQFSKLGMNVLLDKIGNGVGLHIRNRTDGELANDLGWDNSLVARVVESTFNTVNGKGRVSPAVLQNFTFSVMNVDLAANSAVELMHLKGKVVIGFFLLLCKIDHQ